MTITKEGVLASFYTVNKAPIKHLKVYFSPKQAGSGDASPENVRKISGWNQINTYQSNNNLLSLDIPFQNPSTTNSTATNARIFQPYTYCIGASCTNYFAPSVITEYSIDKNTITVKRRGSVYGVGIAIPLKPGPYYISSVSDGYIHIGYYAENGVYITYNSTNSNSKSFTVPANCIMTVFIFVAADSTGVNTSTFSNIMLNKGNIALPYEPYKGTTQTIDWSSTLDTIYGGYIDLITGELIQEQIGQTFKGSDADQVTELTNTKKFRFRFYKALKGNGTTKAGITYCDKLQYQYHEDDKLHYYFTANNSNGNAYVYLPKDFSDNDEVTIIASLYTPELVTTLTPIELQTLIGQNNIWSNADRVEVEYDLAESNDELYRRRNIILQGAPHLETVSGTIAHFNTDLVAPIKSAKFYFEPIQSPGTPSPTNIKPITGYKKLNMHQFEKNLFNISTDTIGSKYINYSDGSIVTWGSSWNISNYLPIDANTQYTITCRNTGLANAGLAFYDSNQTYISGIKNSHSSTVNFDTTTFTTPVNATYLRFTFVEPQIYPTILVKDTSILLNSYTRDWSSEDTLYGGYIDLVTGDLYQEWCQVKIADKTWYNYSGKIHYYISNIAPTNDGVYDRAKNTYIYSDTLTPRANGNFIKENVGEFTYMGEGMTQNSYYNNIWTALPEAMEHAEANAWIKETYPDATICYKLANPIYITTLTSQQLISFHNINNFQSEAKGQTEIQYWTH